MGHEVWFDCHPGVFPLSDRFAEVDGFRKMTVAASRLSPAMR